MSSVWAWVKRWGALVAAAVAAIAWVLYGHERRARIAAENRAMVQERLSASMAATYAASVQVAAKRRQALRKIERELDEKREVRAAERKRIEDRIRVINETDDLDELAALVNG